MILELVSNEWDGRALSRFFLLRLEENGGIL